MAAPVPAFTKSATPHKPTVELRQLLPGVWIHTYSRQRHAHAGAPQTAIATGRRFPRPSLLVRRGLVATLAVRYPAPRLKVERGDDQCTGILEVLPNSRGEFVELSFPYQFSLENTVPRVLHEVE